MRIILTPLLVLAIAFTIPSSEVQAKVNKKLVIGGIVGVGLMAAIIALLNRNNSFVTNLDPNTSSEEECATPSEGVHTEVMRSPSTFEKISAYISPGTTGMALSQDKPGANGPLQFWDACNPKSKVRGGYFDLDDMNLKNNSKNRMEAGVKCRGTWIHPKLAEQMDKYMLTCAQQGAQAAGLKAPASVFINHVGGYNNRRSRANSSLKSVHAYGKALDIAAIDLVGSNGQVQRMSMNQAEYKGSQGGDTQSRFYDAFRSCWKNNTRCPSGRLVGSSQNASVGCPASHFGGNGLHIDHLHLEYPCN